jgi:YegS/Rv2252/BmrU family lipid kinase
LRRVFVIVNPIAGQGAGRRVFERVERGLRERGLAVESAVTERAGDARVAAGDAGGHDVVVVVGGDGTLNEVVNGLDADVAVAHCPLGTANVLAKELRVPRGIEGFCDMVAAGRERTLDLGAANGRRFVAMAGAGFDAAVTTELHETRSGTIHIGQYVWLLFRRLVRGYRRRLRVCIDGGAPLDAESFVLVSNVRSYGGPLCVTPEAVPDDGVFDVCLLPRGSRWRLLRALAGFFLRCQHGLSGAQYFRGRSVEVSADARVPLQVDGDPAGHLPATIELLERRLRVVVP